MSSANFRGGAEAVEQGLALARSSGIEVWTGSLMMLGVMCAIGRGDLATAHSLLDAMSHAASKGPYFVRGQYAYGRAWVAFERNEIEAALRWLRGCHRDTERLGFQFALCQNALAEVVFEGARRDAAAFAAAAAPMDERVNRAQSPWLGAAADLAKTYGRLRLGEDAISDLRSALRRSREVGIANPAFLGSRVIAHLVTVALEHGIEPAFAGKLLRGYELRPGPEALAMGAWPWPLKIRSLGRLEIEIDGVPLRFGRKAPTVPLALLKMLTVATEPQTAARLSAALWPSYGAHAPRAALDTALYRLRKLLRIEAAIESDNGRIALAPTICWTDARAFVLSCDRIAELSRDGRDPSVEAVERCEQHLLDLYRGPFGTEDDPPPVARAREQLRRRFGRAITDLRRLWLRKGIGERSDKLAMLAAQRDDRVPIEDVRRT